MQVRQLLSTNAEVDEAGPSDAVQMFGLSAVPKAGDEFVSHTSLDQASLCPLMRPEVGQICLVYSQNITSQACPASCISDTAGSVYRRSLCTVRFGSTTEVLAERVLKHHRIS